MSNIVLDAVLTQGNVYPLISLPSSLSKAWEVIPTLALKDEFVYVESISNTVNAEFRHILTGVVCKLPTNLFLDHNRYYYPTNEKNAVKKALYICTDSLLYPYGSTLQALRQPVRAGTIFKSYHVEGNFYVVEDNKGNRLRAYKNIARPVVDIEDSNTDTKLNAVKKSETIQKPDLVKVPTSDIKVLTTYSVLGKTFTSKEDADFVAEVLASIATHTFKDSNSINSLKELVAESVEIDLDITQS